MDIGVIGLEAGAQQPRPLIVVDEHGGFVLLAHLPQQSGEQAADRARDAGVKARVLLQQRGEQCRAGTRQARDEVDAVLHVAVLLQSDRSRFAAGRGGIGAAEPLGAGLY